VNDDRDLRDDELAAVLAESGRQVALLTARVDELSPHDRFRLSAEALARDDLDATNRLWDACPTRTYRQADINYAGRMRAAELICLAFYADLNYLLGKIVLVEALSASMPGMIVDAMTRGYVSGYRDAGGNPDEMWLEDPDEVAETNKLVLERSKRIREEARTHLGRKAAGQWRGFCRFAREDAGVEPEVLARGFMPRFDIPNLSTLEFDEEDAMDCHEALRRLWDQRLELYGARAAR
jgi:muconolactone delta-isomerase